MSSDYDIMSIKLYPEVGNDEYIILCNFDGRSMSGGEETFGLWKQKKAGLNGVKMIFLHSSFLSFVFLFFFLFFLLLSFYSLPVLLYKFLYARLLVMQ